MSDRKARLAALAAKAGRTNNKTAASSAPEDDLTEGQAVVGNGGDQQQADDDARQKQQQAKNIKFRNYTPADASLEAAAAGTADDEPDSKRPRVTANDTRKNSSSTQTKEEPSALERALEKARAEAAVVPAASAAQQSSQQPSSKKRSINWDLKRDIQPKLDRLEKRTQKAIVALLKERLEREAAAEEGDGNDID